MAENKKTKSLNVGYIIVAVVVVALVIFGIVKLAQNSNWKSTGSANSITISDNDSKEVKIEKLQKKIELLNKDVEDIQNKINPELEKLNSLYEEYVNIMNENQTGEPVVEDTTQTEETVEATEETPAE